MKNKTQLVIVLCALVFTSCSSIPKELMEPPEIKPEEICSSKMKKKAKCWQKLDSPADCYIHRTNQPEWDQSYTWSGTCLGGVPHGKGVLHWIYYNPPPFPNASGDSIIIRVTYSGLKQYGQRHGVWLEDNHEGNYTAKKEYVNGKLITHYMRGTKSRTCSEVVYDSQGETLGLRNVNPAFCDW